MKVCQQMFRACNGVLRFVMEAGAKGCEVIVTGKLRAARAKAMKFKDGYMISSGNPTKEFIDSAVRHVLLRQGCLGIKVRNPACCLCGKNSALLPWLSGLYDGY
jgi:ribosomal protein S3